ncbi:transcriptional regulator [Nocardia sp. NPDC059195]|uniref:transcriptional regulator n=1 Tax=Nocardia sp. NPDC059195 TaxID=3346765 RepID=UPI003694852A
MSNPTSAGPLPERNDFATAVVREYLPNSTVLEIAISDVSLPDSPLRAAGVSASHVRMLTESAAKFPPIVVHRPTMQVIDGWHRLRAAEQRGDSKVAAVFFDGSPAEVFVLAVKLNGAHGLPLSLADRKAAALRILTMHPSWSDRSIAALVGISHKTVGAIRERSAGEIPQPTSRMASNGVMHQVDGRQRRQHAAELFSADPGASARKIARAAGISVTTAKDVRKQLKRAGGSGVGRSGAGGSAGIAELGDRLVPPVVPGAGAPTPSTEELARQLRKDPSLRFTEVGRKLLHWLEFPLDDVDDWDSVISNIPSHCLPRVAALARRRAQDWEQLTTALDRYTQTRRCVADPPQVFDTPVKLS